MTAAKADPATIKYPS